MNTNDLLSRFAQGVIHDTETIDRLARGVIRLANRADLIRDQWAKDPDINRALNVLGWSVDQARTGP